MATGRALVRAYASVMLPTAEALLAMNVLPIITPILHALVCIISSWSLTSNLLYEKFVPAMKLAMAMVPVIIMGNAFVMRDSTQIPPAIYVALIDTITPSVCVCFYAPYCKCLLILQIVQQTRRAVASGRATWAGTAFAMRRTAAA